MLGQRDSIGISTAIARLREREYWRKRAPNKWIVSRYNRDRTAISFILLRFELHYAASFPVRGNLQTGGKLVPAREGNGNGIREQFENFHSKPDKLLPVSRPMICKYFFIANFFNDSISVILSSSLFSFFLRRYQTWKISRNIDTR